MKCKTCRDTGRIECYRDADEPCPDCERGRETYKEWYGHYPTIGSKDPASEGGSE